MSEQNVGGEIRIDNMKVTPLSTGEVTVLMGHDLDIAREFCDAFFTLESEKALLSEDQKELKADYKEKLDMPLMNKIVALVKAQVKLDQVANKASPETIAALSNVVLEKMNKILGD